MTMSKPLAVYIHFPYCKSRCPYCDFFRGILPKNFDESLLVERYINDLEYMATLCGKRVVSSIFFGGGTPSLFSFNALGYILDEISKHFDIDKNAEITLEANPNTYDCDKFKGFHQVGINRLSLGVQALNQQDLRFLGRTHSVDDALRAMEYCSSLFERFSVDLIYARPHQNFEEWQKEIDLALNFGLKHISLYELSIEEGTPFYRKNIETLDDEAAANLYEQTVLYLREKGLERYEVSNFAVSGEESRHNLVYWQGGDYIGLGEGAHGRLHLDNHKILATENGKIASELTPEERAQELVIMGLRIRDGIQAKTFYEYCGIKLFDFLSKKMTKKLAELNLLCYDADEIKLTDKGFLLLDEIIFELLR